MEPTIDQAWQQAVAAHESGNWPEAERRYRAMLQDRPGHPDANHHLGLLAVAVGKPDAALPFLKTALEADPARGQYWIGYIDTLIKAGQIDNARQVLQQGRHLGLQGEAVDRLEQLVCAPAPAQRETLSGILTPSQAAYHRNVLAMRASSNIDYPAHVHLETFAKCNAACSFCPYSGLARKGTRMSDRLIEKIVCDLEDIPRSHGFQLSPFKVNEPFLDHRLFDLLDIFRTRLPNASMTITTNASPITAKTLARLARLDRIGYLWISFNDHRQAEYEATMQLPYRRTIERLNLIHKEKAAGRLHTRVVLSRVGDRSPADAAFVQWVNASYPLFEVSVFPRGEWLGQVASSQDSLPPNVGCVRWFDMSITATGIVAHCCMDGKAQYPIGDVREQHVLEIYNRPDYRKLRANTQSRLEVEPCRGCRFL